MHIILGLLAVVVSFGFIVAIHEFGHFLAARRAGIRCPEFAIGFGPLLFSRRWWGTDFSLRAIPLGGYVMMDGEDPVSGRESAWGELIEDIFSEVDFPATREQLYTALEAKRDTLSNNDYELLEEHIKYLPWDTVARYEDVEGSFYTRSYWDRAITICGGVIMNFLAASLIFGVVGMIWGAGSFSPDPKPRVAGIMSGSPAEGLGLNEGDQFLSVEGVPVVSTWDLVQQIKPHGGNNIAVALEHEGKEKQILIRPDIYIGEHRFRWKEGSLFAVQEVEGKLELHQVIKPNLELPEGSVATALGQYYEDKNGSEQTWTLSDGSELKLPADSEVVGRIGVQLGSYAAVVAIEPDELNTVTSVRLDSLGKKLGFKPQDEVVAIQGAAIFGKRQSDAILSQLAQGGRTGRVTVYRPGTQKIIDLELDRPIASLRDLEISFQEIPWYYGFVDAGRWIARLTTMPAVLLVKMFQNEVPSSVLVETSQGPLGIMQNIYALAQSGLPQLLFFVGVLNIAIGAFNILPFPALDGGRLAVLFVSWVTGIEISPENEAKFHFIGIIILLSLAFIITLLDVQRLLSGVQLIQ